MNQIEQIGGMTKTVKVREHEIIVRTVTMKNLAAFTAVCSPFLGAFDEAGELSEKNGQPPSEFALFELLARHSDAFMSAAAMVSNTEVNFYERLLPDEFFEVASAVVEVNGGFFVKRLLPAIVKLAQGIQALGNPTGLIALENLSQQVMAQEANFSNTPLTPSLAS